MKKIIFLLLAQIATIAHAQDARYSMLKLRLSDTSMISVRLDGVYIDRHTRSLTLDGIRPGFHHLEVYSYDEARRRRFRIYTGTVSLRAGNVNVGVVDVYGRSLGMRVRTMSADDRAYAEGHHQEQKPGAQDQQDDIYRQTPDDHGIDNKVPEAAELPQEHRNVEIVPGAEGLSGSTMDDLRIRVQALFTDSEKEALLKKDLDSQRLNTAQLREIMSWLAFESTRLSIAQWSYSRIEDQDQFPTLENVFEYTESKKDFRKIFGGDR